MVSAARFITKWSIILSQKKHPSTIKTVFLCDYELKNFAQDNSDYTYSQLNNEEQEDFLKMV
jgi:hypothetical protein